MKLFLSIFVLPRIVQARSFASSERGNISFWSIIAGLMLLIAYLTMPDMFHNFFHYLTKFLFDTLHDAFGTSGPDGATGQEAQPQSTTGK